MRILNEKVTDAGSMVVKEDDHHTRYEITTFAGKWRGGKIYNASKVIQILNGTCILTWQPDGEDDEVILTPYDGNFHIPEGIPHVFYFPELTSMIETFPKGTKTQEFERYRAMKK